MFQRVAIKSDKNMFLFHVTFKKKPDYMNLGIVPNKIDETKEYEDDNRIYP
jgi:hypothetical protein